MCCFDEFELMVPGDIKRTTTNAMEDGYQNHTAGKYPESVHPPCLTWIVSTEIEEFDDSDESETGDDSKRTTVYTGSKLNLKNPWSRLTRLSDDYCDRRGREWSVREWRFVVASNLLTVNGS